MHFSWLKKKVPKHVYVYSILRNQSHVEVKDKYVDSLDVLDDVEWNEK